MMALDFGDENNEDDDNFEEEEDCDNIEGYNDKFICDKLNILYENLKFVVDNDDDANDANTSGNQRQQQQRQ